MKKLLLLLTVFLLGTSTLLYGQERTVTGVVTSAEDSMGMPGVTVIIKGTNIATATDASGKYSIKAPTADAVIGFSFIGYKPITVEIGNQSLVNAVMQTDVIGVEEVVVTALGIQKKARGLTYSTQQVSGADLTTAKDVNPLNALGGRTAGLVIGRSSSGVGGSSSIIIRGAKSISNENQPLYVIDGIPINKGSVGSMTSVSSSGVFDAGDVISNINSEDIESINVLKGAAASALYGSLGQNGVVLITTKKGAAGQTTVEFTNTFTIDQAMKELYPELQGNYGTDPLDTILTNNRPETWGERNNTSSTGGFLDELFRLGTNNISNISITSGNDKNQLYVSFGNTISKGIVSENTMNKNNFYIKGISKLSKRFSVEASATLTNQLVKNRILGGFYHNPILDSYIWPLSDERYKYYKENYEYFNPRSAMYEQNNYPFQNIGSSFITDLPFWTINRKTNELKRDRDIYTIGLKYEFSKVFSVSTRTSYDKINDGYNQKIYATSSSGNVSSKGGYLLNNNKSDQLFSDILLSYNNDAIYNFSLALTAGASNTYSTSYGLTANGTSKNVGMEYPNIFNVWNLKSGYSIKERSTEVLSQAVFGAITLGWKNMIFLDATGRNEWSSTIIDLSPNNFFYPSVGGTFVVSELTGTNNIFSFAKLRATYSEVGNALPVGVNLPINKQEKELNADGSLGAPASAIPLGKPLKPELSKSVEMGANIRLFNNSVDLDVTLYRNNVENQFLSILAESGFGATNKLINSGKIKNEGIELMLTYKIAPVKDLLFTTSFNMAYNKNVILELADSANNLVVADYKDATINLLNGDPMGDIYATDFLRDENGKIIVTGGSPSRTDSFVKVGNVTVPLTIGWSNSISYKRFDFRFLIEGKFGGDVYSRTEVDLDATGRSKRSGDARDQGFVVFEGDTVARGDAEIKTWFTDVSQIGGNYIYDATNIRLREVSLGYNFPVGFTNGILKKLNFSVYGRNLLFFVIRAPFDPEVAAGNSIYQQGIEMYSMPSNRTYGFSIRATF